MANSYETFIDAVQHVPTEVTHPVLAGAAVAAVTGVDWLARQYMAHNTPQGAVDLRRNANALRNSQLGTEKATDRQLYSPVRTLLLGTGLIAVQFVGQPGYDASFPDTTAESVVVLDVSNSMHYSHDVGDSPTSRYQASVTALKQAEFSGSLGFIQTANSTKIISKPAKNWQALTVKLEKPQVDTNGGQLVPAMEQAASLLPADPESQKREGTIVVVSDGTVNETAAQMSEAAAKLRQQGVSVRVVVPGTSTGTYILPGTTKPAKAGVTPDVFAAFGDNVVKAKSVDEIKAAIHNEVKAAGTGHEHRDWPVPGIVGGAIFLAGVSQLVKRVIKRT